MTDFHESDASISLSFDHSEPSRSDGPKTPVVQRRPYNRRMYLSERALKLAYAGAWPRRLWGLIPGAMRVRRVERELLVRPSRNGRPALRIGFVSDLHLGPTTPPQLVENAFAELREARLDVLALGGDYVFLGASPGRMERLQRLVASVPARTKVAVLGNHDFWARPERVVNALVRGGARVLVDQGLRLPPPHDDIGVIGLDDPLTSGHIFDEEAARAGARRALRFLPAGLSAVVAVAHSPDSLPGLRGSGVKVLLCGHTHGGQIALPGYRPLVMPSRIGRRYPFGVHHLEDEGLTLFVSRGLGTSMIPLRTWAPEDLAVFTLN